MTFHGCDGLRFTAWKVGFPSSQSRLFKSVDSVTGLELHLDLLFLSGETQLICINVAAMGLRLRDFEVRSRG